MKKNFETPTINAICFNVKDCVTSGGIGNQPSVNIDIGDSDEQ